ncbi:hypothetical protein EXN66_Car019867 [Channa argus]|uniref:Uncharacterized protein n=1 Tax=Channa argus TaxID=215402 RepID=A0A6G1QP94_CHAAH|nr:hypothetical protein EXN66_Car019867 [Channa argus]
MLVSCSGDEMEKQKSGAAERGDGRNKDENDKLKAYKLKSCRSKGALVIAFCPGK